MYKTNEFVKEVEDSLKALAEETDNVKKSDFFKQYLETMSRFWKYSYHNQLLIHFAMPKATKVAGFRKWQELKRYVTKGSKAIKILAPCFKTVKVTDANNEEKEEQITFFFPVNVFDISQTEGQQLPEIEITVTGDNYKDFLESLSIFCNERSIKLNFKNLGVNGLYGYSTGGMIAISSTESINTQVNTMIHEIAHELLHKESKLDKQQMEIQAEGTAYVVTKHFGLENKSFNYLAMYDADYTKIIDNIRAVAEASREIMRYLEEGLVGG